MTYHVNINFDHALNSCFDKKRNIKKYINNFHTINIEIICLFHSFDYLSIKKISFIFFIMEFHIQILKTDVRVKQHSHIKAYEKYKNVVKTDFLFQPSYKKKESNKINFWVIKVKKHPSIICKMKLSFEYEFIPN